MTAERLIRVLLELDQQCISGRPSPWGRAAELVATLAEHAEGSLRDARALGDWRAVDLSPARRRAPGELHQPTLDAIQAEADGPEVRHVRTPRGFERAGFSPRRGGTVELQQSSAIDGQAGNDAINRPGSSLLWLRLDGESLSLDRAEVRAVARLMARWAETGHLAADAGPANTDFLGEGRMEDRHDIEAIVKVVRAEYDRTMDFGMTPAPEDYRIAIEEWLRDGVMPGEQDAPGTTLGDLRRPDDSPVDIPPVGRDPGPSSGTPTTGLGVCYRCGRQLAIADAAWMPDGRPVHPGCEPVGRDADFGGGHDTMTGKYPDLTDAENETIRRAREAGFGLFYPACPDRAARARATLAGAEEYLSRRGLPAGRDAGPVRGPAAWAGTEGEGGR